LIKKIQGGPMTFPIFAIAIEHNGTSEALLKKTEH
jgi:hypothetical protein